MIGAALDWAISQISPSWGLKRTLARDAIRSLIAGKDNRLTNPFKGRQESGDPLNSKEIQQSRWNARRAYRNNPYCRKIVHAIVSQVIGCGLKPESQAVNADGTPNVKFRAATKKLWQQINASFDYVGLPGKGGSTRDQLFIQALTAVILDGEILIRKRYLTDAQVKREKRTIPFSIQLIEADQLDESASFVHQSVRTGNVIYRGIEYDENGFRVAYWIRKFHPQDQRNIMGKLESERVDADEIIHLFWRDFPSQQRGLTWLSASLNILNEIDDYRFDELTAARVAACVVLSIVTNTLSAPMLNTPSGGDSSDDAGNTYERMQPGQILKLRPGEQITGFNPARPNADASDFTTLMLRAAAVGAPGVKASTLHGDYRESSYSSEKAADNDVWREVEQLQEWFASDLCQLIWELVIETAVMSGWFARNMDNRTFRTLDFVQNRERYLPATWDGPVPKSIQPDTDAQASKMLVANGQSNVATEASNIGMNWYENMEKNAEIYETGIKLGLPKEYMLGLLMGDTLAQAAVSAQATSENTDKQIDADEKMAKEDAKLAAKKPATNGSVNGTAADKRLQLIRMLETGVPGHGFVEERNGGANGTH